MNVDISKVTDLEERNEALRLYEEWAKADMAVEDAAKTISDEAYIALRKKRDAAWAAYENHPIAVMLDYDGNAKRCALSGIPLIDTDELLEDTHTDDLVLRCFVLPPRKVEAAAPEEAEAAA